MKEIKVKVPALKEWQWAAICFLGYFIIAGLTMGGGIKDCLRAKDTNNDGYSPYCYDPEHVIPGILWPLTIPIRIGMAIGG